MEGRRGSIGRGGGVWKASCVKFTVVYRYKSVSLRKRKIET